jgi:peptide/nickel transport system permease protein
MVSEAVGAPAGASPASRSRLSRLDMPARRPSLWRRVARNRMAVIAMAFLVLLIASAVFAPAVSRYDPEAIDLMNQYQGPSWTHWLGTDESGRDYFARLIYGGRVSLTIGFVSIVLAVGIGALGGAIAGYVGGWPGAIVMRLADGLLAIPIFFFLLIALAVFGTTLTNIVIVIGLTSWMGIARVVRSEVLRTAHLDFVTAARTLGATHVRMLFRHILPQAVPSIIVTASLGIAQAILVESSLSYLGLGVQPPESSWGNLLANAQMLVFTAPQLAIYPGLTILLTVIAFNSLGDALRDALDPS